MARRNAPLAGLIRWAEPLSVLALIIIAGAFRWVNLVQLPPGLATAEARVGLESVNLINHGAWPGLDSFNSYAPAWIWLQAIMVKLFGPTQFALRLLPAILGVLAVVLTWLWLRDWFGRRIGLLGAFLLAVVPWSVTLTRNATATALVLVVVPLVLWTAGRVYRRESLGRWLAAGGALLVSLLAGPLGWLLAVVVAGAGLLALGRRRDWRASAGRLVALGLVAGGVAYAGWLAADSHLRWAEVAHATGWPQSLAAFGQSLVTTLLMFNVRGDDNIRHNLAGQPMFNAFVGLMLLAGLLIGIARLHQRRYRILLSLALLMLVPAILSAATAPNAAHAIGALPLLVAVAAIGTSYMLELWYATFPINSAARTTGQVVVGVLMGLTAIHGQAQYFRAWAQSIDTYAGYEEPAVAAAKYATAQPYAGQRFVVAVASELPVVEYLQGRRPTATRLEPAAVTALPVGPGARQFIITAQARDQAARQLSLKFPGGKLRPQLSAFSGNEIYYVYEVTP